MVIPRSFKRRLAGALMTELIIALGIVMGVMVPMAYSYLHHQDQLRACYYRSVAMEILDGEMEVLVAGEWRAFKPGTNAYTIRARSAANLPPGSFKLTLEGSWIRLDWVPRNSAKYHSMKREARIQ
jgi:hypothetical protein